MSLSVRLASSKAHIGFGSLGSGMKLMKQEVPAVTQPGGRAGGKRFLSELGRSCSMVFDSKVLNYVPPKQAYKTG